MAGRPTRVTLVVASLSVGISSGSAPYVISWSLGSMKAAVIADGDYSEAARKGYRHSLYKTEPCTD